MYLEETAGYIDTSQKERILDELFHNAYRTIKSVYLFKHFEDYILQLHSNKNEDKKEIYWNTSYYEKLIDYVKISIAFENYNKAILLQNGILVHKIKRDKLYKKFNLIQSSGRPVYANDFLKEFGTNTNLNNEIYLNGLTDNFQTINYSDTLNENYQQIIKLDFDLNYRLKEINEKRNRLHFFTDFKGAFEVKSHINKWRFIMDKSIATIEKSNIVKPY